jgi:hypothetical protein
VGSYVVGRLASDAQRLDRRGWVVGSFFQQGSDQGERHCSALEVKYWSYPRGGGGSHGVKSSFTTEWSLIMTGRTRALIDDSLVELEGGDYVLIHPGTPNNLVAEVLEDMTAITVKAPSEPTAKTLV